MPTGYTAAIQEGATFKEFALQCARAFGAAIMQRDEPLDSPLQTVVEPSDYHLKALENAIEAKAQLDAMQHWEWSDLLDKHHADKLNSITEAKNKANELRAKYEAVLADVNKWNPPTEEHKGIKEFMQSQIAESINFDCSTSYYDDYTKPSLEQFKIDKYKSVNQSIEYHTKQHEAEVKRCAERTKWLTDYVKSLGTV